MPSDDRFPGEPHWILREIRSELERHPIVTATQGHPSSTFVEIRATLAPERWGRNAEDSTLRVTWQPIDPLEFSFHYSDAAFDCGWHHEPNPHVEGSAHYQERSDGDYEYEAVTFEGETPTELVWEVMERLRRRLQDRPGSE